MEVSSLVDPMTHALRDVAERFLPGYGWMLVTLLESHGKRFYRLLWIPVLLQMMREYLGWANFLLPSRSVSFAHNEDVLNSSVCRSTSCDLMRFTLYS